MCGQALDNISWQSVGAEAWGERGGHFHTRLWSPPIDLDSVSLEAVKAVLNESPFTSRTITIKITISFSILKNSRVHTTAITIKAERNNIVGITIKTIFFTADER